MKTRIAFVATFLSLAAALLAYEATSAPANSLPAQSVQALSAKHDGPFPLCPPYCSPDARK